MSLFESDFITVRKGYCFLQIKALLGDCARVAVKIQRSGWRDACRELILALIRQFFLFLQSNHVIHDL
jgi:hypothetical protein